MKVFTVHTVEIRIETTPIDAAVTRVSVRFVVLDFDSVGAKAKNAVARVVATAIGQHVMLVDRVFTVPRDHIVPARLIHIVATHVDVSPQMFGGDLIAFKFHRRTR